MSAAKWIKVEKRLPKRGEQVIVAYRQYDWSNSLHKYRKLKGLGVVAATYWREDENGPRFCYGHNGVVGEPVAWMRMPDPPAVK